MSEHKLQYAIVELLKLHRITVLSTDVMSGLAYFSQKDPRRFAFINHHKKMGYIVGQSDLIILHKGKMYFAEIKTASGKQTEKQKDFEKLIKELGYEYFIWHNIDEVMNFIKKEKDKCGTC